VRDRNRAKVLWLCLRTLQASATVCNREADITPRLVPVERSVTGSQVGALEETELVRDNFHFRGRREMSATGTLAGGGDVSPRRQGGGTVSRTGVSSFAFQLLVFEAVRDADERGRLASLEQMGFSIGSKFAERFTMTKPRFPTTLDVVKFLCKELWTTIFGKQIDKLQTNHKGVFVLHDNLFSWMRQMEVDYRDDDSIERAKNYLMLPCGLIRGALSNLGIKSTVHAEFSALPTCFFNIAIQEERVGN